MNVFILFAHPEPKSFNGAMFSLAAQTLASSGHEVRFSDLHAMNFEPRITRQGFTTVSDPDYFKPQAEEQYASEHDGFTPDIDEELDKLFWCDLLIVQFPLWWFGFPAILKGWFDRVLVQGRTYGAGRMYGSGLLRGRRALLSITTGAPNEFYVPGGVHGDINTLLYPLHKGVFRFVGFDVLAPQVVCSPARATPEERLLALQAWGRRLESIRHEQPMNVV